MLIYFLFQVSNLRKECEELKLKLLDYEKMSKFQRVMSTDSEVEGYKVKQHQFTIFSLK